jgi:hypothetical protein
MRTFQVPREAWVEELNRFTIMHEGWLATLEVFGQEIGAQREIANLPLLGVSADRVDQDGTIVISVARSAVEHLTHIIEGVAHIYVEQPNDGATAALQVESVDGTKTLLQLRAPGSPNPEAPVVDPPGGERNTSE